MTGQALLAARSRRVLQCRRVRAGRRLDVPGRSSAWRHERCHSLHQTYLEIVSVWKFLDMFACTLSCVFLLVINTWASMAEQVSGGGATSGLRTGWSAIHGGLSSRDASAPSSSCVLFIKMVLSVYALQLVTFLLQHRVPESIMCGSIYLVATLLLGCFFIVYMFLMPAYGGCMCNLLSPVAEGAPQRQRNIRRIAAIATVVCLMHMSEY